MRRILLVLVLALLGSLLVATPAAGSDSPWLRLPPPTHHVQTSIEQLAVTDVEPGRTVNLFHSVRDKGNRSWRSSLLASAIADEAGTVLFRELDPNGYYHVQVGREVTWLQTVDDEADSLPDPRFYDGQTLEPGFQYIETRDGTLLSANVVLPGPPEDGPYPTVVEYSGYDPANPTTGPIAGACPALPTTCSPAAQPGSQLAGLFGFAVVGVNVRGTGCSGGAYDFFETLQVTDGYDVIETVAAQDWVKGGKVGMVGLSYPGISQLFVAKSNPPSLAAITPLSVYADTGTGVSRPGGILNTGFATSWAENVLGNAAAYGSGWVRQLVDEGDEVCDRNQRLRGHNVDAAQKARDELYYTDEVAAPLDIRTWANDIQASVFLASAWQDEQTGPSFGDLIGEFESAPVAKYTVYNGLHGDGFSPEILAEWSAFLQMYVADQKPFIDPLVRFVTPVFTGGIFGDAVGFPPDRWEDVATADEARSRFESEPPIRVLMDRGAIDGAGLPETPWEASSDEWPLPGTEAARWYLTPDGTLGPERPKEGSSSSFHPDPDIGEVDFFGGSSSIWRANPAYDWQPTESGRGLSWETAPLTTDMVMAGTGSVDLWVSSTANDADLEVVLTEIRPDGNQSYVQVGQLRASYRALDKASSELEPIQVGREDDIAPLPPGVAVPVRVKIPDFAHAFRAGSRIRIEVNTPGGDQPRWAYELLGLGDETTHQIAMGASTPSSIALPHAVGVAVPTELPACPSLRGQPCRATPPLLTGTGAG